MAVQKVSKKKVVKKVAKKEATPVSKHNARSRTFDTREEGRAAIARGEYDGY